MPRLPRTPPLPLPELAAGDVLVLAAATVLWRIHRAGGEHPSTWAAFRATGPMPSGRFDHHRAAAPEAAVLYLGSDIATCLAEVFERRRLVDRSDGRPYLVGIELARDVVLLDLAGDWPTRAGASQAIATGPRRSTQAWARAIHEAYPGLDGVGYRSLMRGPGLNVALTERARDVIGRYPLVHMPLDHIALEVPLRRIASSLGYGLR